MGWLFWFLGEDLVRRVERDWPMNGCDPITCQSFPPRPTILLLVDRGLITLVNTEVYTTLSVNTICE